MPIEIEAKMKVDDLAPVRERLHECGAEHVGEYLETNIFFDTEDRRLLQADEGLRLRQKRDLARNEESFILTFKGPRQAGSLKMRDEVELHVMSGRDALELLRCLRFLQVLSFEKKRQSWKLDGCSVELDEMPHLGTYVEIEGPSETAVMELRQKLGLDSRPLIKASYTAMLMTHLEERGSSERAITFDGAS